MAIYQKYVYLMQFEWKSVVQFLGHAFNEQDKGMLYNVA